VFIGETGSGTVLESVFEPVLKLGPETILEAVSGTFA